MRNAFETGINQHGHAFHYRVIHEVLVAASRPHSRIPWELLAVEMPVSAGGRSTRIDFLLEDQTQSALRILVAEVKRVNPAFGRWCFAKVPDPRPVWTSSQIVTEHLVELNQEGGGWASGGFGGAESSRLYQIAFVLKSSGGGDAHPVGNDKDAIEVACTQVCRGLNGLVDGLVHDERLHRHIQNRSSVVLLPVIFTTARLSATSANLAEANLETGELTADDSVENLDWLIYQYPQSPDLKHTVSRGALENDSLDVVVARDFVRSVAIVRPSGILNFLRWASHSVRSGRD